MSVKTFQSIRIKKFGKMWSIRNLVCSIRASCINNSQEALDYLTANRSFRRFLNYVRVSSFKFLKHNLN